MEALKKRLSEAEGKLREADRSAREGSEGLERSIKRLEGEVDAAKKETQMANQKVVAAAGEVAKVTAERDGEKEKIKDLENRLREAQGEGDASRIRRAGFDH